MFSDPFVRSVLSFALVLFFVVLSLPVVGALYLLISTGVFSSVESDTALMVIGFYNGFAGLPETVAGPLLQFIPAIIAVICFTQEKTILSWLGRLIFLIAVLLLVGSVVVLLLVNPDSSEQVRNVSGGKATLDRLHDAAVYCFGLAVTYVGLLTGFAITSAKPEGGK